MTAEVDLVIVGAGAAGLAAAKEAKLLGLSYTLIEASHRIGGRAYTEDLAPGVPFDLGCHWMHSASLNPFVAIADQYGFSYEKDWGWNSDIFMKDAWLTKDQLQDVEAAGEANDTRLEKAVAEGRDVAVSDVIDLDSPWEPFHSYWFSLGTSRDIDQVSTIDDGAYNETEEDWPVKEGFGALVARWATDAPVTLNAPAKIIRWGKGGVSVETPKGTITGKRLLVCVSTNVLASGNIKFEPGLPEWKLEAARELPLGVHNRIAILLEDDPFDPDVPDDAAIFLDGDEVPMSVDIKPYGLPYVSGVTGGRFGLWLERAGQQAAVDYLTERLVKVYGSHIAKSLSPRVIVTAWEGDPWTLGSYSAATPGNGHMRAELARPVDDIVFFAGEATHTSFFSTCHGAYLSGIDQVRDIARRLKVAA